MEENLNELIKTDNAATLTFKKVKQPKRLKSKNIKPKPVFQTKEWADRNENCMDGCVNSSNLEIGNLGTE